MTVLYLGLFGLLVFVAAELTLGSWLRRNRSKENAEKSSRVMHFLFFAALGVPFVIAFFTPGLGHLDELVGLPAFPQKTIARVAGILILLPGLYLMVKSNVSLRALGRGANAFKLTKTVVESDVYRFTRNPMSLGYYLIGLGISLISGSILLTLYTLFGIIPAHLLFLLYFEELELKLRFGEGYEMYKREVPFLFPRMRS